MENRTMVIYKMTNPDSGEPFYIGTSSSIDNAHNSLYKQENEPLRMEIVALRALGRPPLIELIEEVPEEKAVSRKEYWIDFYRQEMKLALFNKALPFRRVRPAKRRIKTLQQDTYFLEVRFPAALLENKAFRKYIRYEDSAFTLLSTCVCELVMDKIEALEEEERQQEWTNS